MKKTINMRTAVVAAAALAAFGLMAAGAFAQGNPHGDTRPGWGFGDDNHVHTGPPGHTVHPVH
jgi:hypothetical protein